MTKALARWIIEADALETSGIPSGAFTLVLDGDEYPELVQHVFQSIVQKDAAWQIALDMSYDVDGNGLPRPLWFDRRHRCGYMYEAAPRILRDITSGTFSIRCKFDPGHEYSAKAVVRERAGLDIKAWEARWQGHQLENNRGRHEIPWPDWHLLRAHQLIPP